MNHDNEQSFLDSPKVQKKIVRWFYISLCLLLCFDLIAYLLFPRHGHFPWEEVPGFSAAYGFVACVGLIFVARVLRWIVKRKEDYYD